MVLVTTQTDYTTIENGFGRLAVTLTYSGSFGVIGVAPPLQLYKDFNAQGGNKLKISFDYELQQPCASYLIINLTDPNGYVLHTETITSPTSGVYTFETPAYISGNCRISFEIPRPSGGIIGQPNDPPCSFYLDNFTVTSYSNCVNPEAGYAANRSSYRFGFNGKEKVDEVYGDANAYDFGARLYDPRLGRWMAVDPLSDTSPFNSPYNYSSNSPISMVDRDGKKEVYYVTVIDKEGNKQSFVVTNEKNIYRKCQDQEGVHWVNLSAPGHNGHVAMKPDSYDRYTDVTIDMRTQMIALTKDIYVKQDNRSWLGRGIDWLDGLLKGGIQVWGDGTGGETGGRSGKAWKIGDKTMSIDLGSEEFETIMFAIGSMKSGKGPMSPKKDMGPDGDWVNDATAEAVKESQKEQSGGTGTKNNANGLNAPGTDEGSFELKNKKTGATSSEIIYSASDSAERAKTHTVTRSK